MILSLNLRTPHLLPPVSIPNVSRLVPTICELYLVVDWTPHATPHLSRLNRPVGSPFMGPERTQHSSVGTATGSSGLPRISVASNVIQAAEISLELLDYWFDYSELTKYRDMCQWIHSINNPSFCFFLFSFSFSWNREALSEKHISNWVHFSTSDLCCFWFTRSKGSQQDPIYEKGPVWSICRTKGRRQPVLRKPYRNTRWVVYILLSFM